MLDRNSQLELLFDLEARHDEVLARLEELDQRVSKTLAECLSVRQAAIAQENKISPLQNTVISQ